MHRPILTACYFVLFLAEWPLMSLRYLSIPAADCGWDGSRRALLLLTPPFAALLLLVEASGGDADVALRQRVPGLNAPAWLVLAGAGAVLSALLMWGTRADDPPRYHHLLVLCGFVIAVVWLDLLAGEVRVEASPGFAASLDPVVAGTGAGISHASASSRAQMPDWVASMWRANSQRLHAAGGWLSRRQPCPLHYSQRAQGERAFAARLSCAGGGVQAIRPSCLQSIVSRRLLLRRAAHPLICGVRRYGLFAVAELACCFSPCPLCVSAGACLAASVLQAVAASCLTLDVLFLLAVSAFLTLHLFFLQVVAIVECVGRIWGISTSILGVTVIAVGNSVGDYVADTAAARGADARMAVAACFGSPLLSSMLVSAPPPPH
jgi:Ca2+/Na+ antiporter